MSPSDYDVRQAEKIGEIHQMCVGMNATLNKIQAGCVLHDKRITRLERLAIAAVCGGGFAGAGLGAWIKGLMP